MEVSRIEFPGPLEHWPVIDRQDPPPPGDQAFAPECLDHPVYVDLGQAKGVSNGPLCEGYLDRVAVREPDCPHAHEQLTEEMGDASVGVPSSHPDHPLAEHRSVDQSVAPARVTDPRMVRDQGAETLVGDEPYLAPGQGPEIVVHYREMQAQQIRNVARDM